MPLVESPRRTIRLRPLSSLVYNASLPSPEPLMTDTEELDARLNLETGRIRWTELQPFFAGGRTVHVCAELDLIRVARAFIQDDSETVRAWRDQGRIDAVTPEQARQWYGGDAELWAVVVAPWVLVQPMA